MYVKLNILTSKMLHVSFANDSLIVELISELKYQVKVQFGNKLLALAVKLTTVPSLTTRSVGSI